MDTSKPKNEPSPRFDIADEKQREQGLKYLEDHGYAVFAEVADAKECKHAENLLWAFLHSLPLNIRQHDIDSWERFPDWSSTTGILFGNGIGQSEFLWFLRGLPRVKQVFESIWQTDELLTSFDGCGLMRPWQYKPKWQTQGSWWHIDQHPVKKPGKICVQGLVSLYDADETTGNLIIIPDSHKLFDQPVITSINARSDFVRIPKPTMEHIEQELGLKAKMVSCKAGDLVLWDSRTIHCNAPALTPPPQPAKNEPYRLLRAAAYICMTPSAFAKDLPDLRRRRYEAFVRQWTSSHWPQDLKLSSSPELPDNRVKLNLQQKALLMGCRADEEQVASLEQAAAEALGRENDQASKQKNHIVWKKKK